MNADSSRPVDLYETINSHAETSLHAALKLWYAGNNDQLEAGVDGFIVDILREDVLIEIQTRHFTALKEKLKTLLPAHTIRVVHPIAFEQWIFRHYLDDTGKITRRKSPKRGKFVDIFRELVRITGWLPHPNLQIEVLLTLEEKHLVNDGQGSWRRGGWRIADRRLIEVYQQYSLTYPEGYLQLLPESLPAEFTTKELAEGLKISRSLAQKMAYTLHATGLLQRVDRQGSTWIYRVSNPPSS